MFNNFIENFFDNLRHFRESFGVDFDMSIASVKNYTKKEEKVENGFKNSREIEGKKPDKKHYLISGKQSVLGNFVAS